MKRTSMLIILLVAMLTLMATPVACGVESGMICDQPPPLQRCNMPRPHRHLLLHRCLRPHLPPEPRLHLEL